jgi:hypothetical protein
MGYDKGWSRWGAPGQEADGHTGYVDPSTGILDIGTTPRARETAFDIATLHGWPVRSDNRVARRRLNRYATKGDTAL